jgi:hypothetical protein
VVKHAAKIGARPARRREQVGTADVTDEQRVAGQHRMWNSLGGSQVVDDDRHRLGGMAGCFEDRQSDRAELDDIAVVQWRGRILRFRRLADVDAGAGPIAQLEVTGDEIGMQVGEEDVSDTQPVLRRERHVLIHVALRVDHRRHLRLLIADEIRGVGEALQVELLKDHTIRDLLKPSCASSLRSQFSPSPPACPGPPLPASSCRR